MQQMTNPAPLQFTTQPDEGCDYKETNAQVLCPVCGGEYVHCGDSYTVDSRDSGYAWSGRGSVTRLQWQGECGHAWELCFGFHKGHTYTWVEQVPTVEGEPVGLSLRDARVRAQTRAAVLAECR